LPKAAHEILGALGERRIHAEAPDARDVQAMVLHTDLNLEH
jgi:hypothetical protein